MFYNKCYIYKMNSIYTVILIFCYGILGEERCFENSSSGKVRTFCCDNHEDRNGTCIECQIGFHSQKGHACQQCPYGQYGRKCGDVCTCSVNEACDHVLGCIIVEQEPISTQVREFPITTPIKLIQVHTSTNITHGRDDTESDINIGGLQNREIIIYSICTGGFAVVFITCSLLLRRKKKGTYRRQFIRTNMQLPPIPRPTENGVYDTIDEVRSLRAVSQENTSICDNYLTPYEPVETKFTKPTTCDSDESDSTLNSAETCCLAYMNPYQPVLNDEVHATHGYSELIKSQNHGHWSGMIEKNILSKSDGAIHITTPSYQSHFIKSHSTEGVKEFVHNTRFLQFDTRLKNLQPHFKKTCRSEPAIYQGFYTCYK